MVTRMTKENLQMRFARLGPVGKEVPVLVTEDKTYDLSPLTEDINAEFLTGDMTRIDRALAQGELSTVNTEGLRIGAPIARPMAVVCVGMNYAAHAAESGAEPPSVPVLFFKHPGTVTGPNDSVEIPRGRSEEHTSELQSRGHI